MERRTATSGGWSMPHDARLALRNLVRPSVFACVCIACSSSGNGDAPAVFTQEGVPRPTLGLNGASHRIVGTPAATLDVLARTKAASPFFLFVSSEGEEIPVEVEDFY